MAWVFQPIPAAAEQGAGGGGGGATGTAAAPVDENKGSRWAKKRFGTKK